MVQRELEKIKIEEVKDGSFEYILNAKRYRVSSPFLTSNDKRFLMDVAFETILRQLGYTIKL